MKPSYYSIIPANVRYDEELKANEKLLYSEITCLSNKFGYCNASNTYFAELYNVSVTSISLWIKNLVEKSYIQSEMIYGEDKKNVIERRLYIFDEGYLRNLKGGYLRKLKGGIKENLKDNTTSINTTSTNIYIGQKFKKPTIEEVEDYIKEEGLKVDSKYFIDYYNSNGWKIGKNPMKDWKATIRNWGRKKFEKEVDVPSWYDKKIESNKMSEEEELELKNMLKEIGG